MASSAGDSRSQRKLREVAARDARIEKDFITASMLHPDGRRFMWNWLSRCGVFTEDENLDLAVMAYRKGIRNQGLALLKLITRHAPSQYIQMTQEATSVDLSISRENDDATDDSDD